MAPGSLSWRLELWIAIRVPDERITEEIGFVIPRR